MTLAQAADSRVGGAWSESCESNEFDLGVRDPGGPTITVPADITVDATSPKGPRSFIRTSRRSARPTASPCRSTASPHPVRSSGSGATPCCAPRPIRTPAQVGLAEFAITVVDGPPQIIASDVDAWRRPARWARRWTATTIVTTSTSSTRTCCSNAVRRRRTSSCSTRSRRSFARRPIDTNQSASADVQGACGRHDAARSVPRCPTSRSPAAPSGGAIVIFNTAPRTSSTGRSPVVCDHPPGRSSRVGKTLVRCFGDRQSRQQGAAVVVHGGGRRRHAAGAQAAEGRRPRRRPAATARA